MKPEKQNKRNKIFQKGGKTSIKSLLGKSIAENVIIVNEKEMSKLLTILDGDENNERVFIFDPLGKYGEWHTENINSVRINLLQSLNSDLDVLRLSEAIIKSCYAETTLSNGGYWKKGEIEMLSALMGYLYHYAEFEEKTFSNIMGLIRAKKIDDVYDASERSALDKIFDYVLTTETTHDDEGKAGLTSLQYQVHCLATPGTQATIAHSLALNLRAFDLPVVRDKTDVTTVHLRSLFQSCKSSVLVIVHYDDDFMKPLYEALNYLIGKYTP